MVSPQQKSQRPRKKYSGGQELKSPRVRTSLVIPKHSLLTGFARLDELNEGAEIQAYLLDKTGQRTVPNVFIRKD